MSNPHLITQSRELGVTVPPELWGPAQGQGTATDGVLGDRQETPTEDVLETNSFKATASARPACTSPSKGGF